MPSRPTADPLTFASFDSDWAPEDYLADYYARVEQDEVHTIAYFVDAIAHAQPGEPILFFGAGPTLHHVFLAASTASEIHLADYLPANLRALDRWLQQEPGAHDWRPFVRYTLQCEGIASPTPAQVAAREELTRAKVTRLLQVDARLRDPLGPAARGRYHTVVSAYCADSATHEHAVWADFMANIGSLVRPRGLLICAALRRCRFYLVGGKPFPCANVDEDDLRAVLEPDFDPTDGSIEARDVVEHAALGYSGIVLARARRRAPSRFRGLAQPA